MKHRQATLADAQLIFEWRNDPITIANSLSGQGVEWFEHERWFKTQIDTNVMCMIGLYVDKPCGVVWIRNSEISINIAPKYRGLGISKYLLQDAMECDKAQAYMAVIKNDNTASIKLFKSCGFKYLGEYNKDFSRLCWTLTA